MNLLGAHLVILEDLRQTRCQDNEVVEIVKHLDH